MFGELQLNLIAISLLLVPLGIVVGMLFLWKWNYKRQKRQKRRSPLTTELIRLPAYGLREKVDDITFDIPVQMTMAMVAPSYFMVIYVYRLWQKQAVSFLDGPLILFSIGAIGGIGWFSYKLIKSVSLRFRLIQAIEAEFATAQELESLKVNGCRLYHDIQADGFNIDHVLVGPNGVYAIETKSRLKPNSDNKKDDARVEFNGDFLKFPGWVEKKPIEQARAQAKWLQDRLSKSVGELVKVSAALALPGWYVDRTGRSDVSVFNPKDNAWLARTSPVGLLNESQIQRISFQLEQLSKIDKS